MRRWIASAALLLLAALGAQAQTVFPIEPVGTASASQTVTVKATTAGTVSSVEILTGGASGLDFAAGSGTSSCTGATLAVNGPCTVSVAFTPTAPGPRYGAVVLVGTVSGSPAVLGTAYFSGVGTGPLSVFVAGNEIPFAGDGDYLGSVGDGKTAASAELYLPSGVAIDGAGNVYIADTSHNRIRMVCASATSATIAGTTCAGAGVISTIAGTGFAGDSGNGPAAAATVNSPGGVAVDGAGNVWVADSGNNEIREIVAATGNIVTVAGGATTVCSGATDSVGDGCAPLQATLNQPLGVTVDAAGDIYIADTNDERIRVITPSTGLITTAAGDGFTNSDGTGGYNGDGITAITAELNSPYGVAFDTAGNMYIPDSGNNRVREVAAVSGKITAASLISTYAGDGSAGYFGDGGLATAAGLWAPSGVALDPAGNLYIADTQNRAIRKVNPTSGDISSQVRAGKGTLYYAGFFSTVNLYGPIGLAIDTSGNLYIADSLDMMVREIQSNYWAVDISAAVRQGSLSTPPSPVTIENDGNSDLDITAITPQTNAQVDGPTTTCVVAPPSQTVNTDCNVGAVFAPTTSGLLMPDIDVTSASQNSPLVIQLIGTATAVNSTTTTVTSAPNPSNFGQSVLFTVTVTTGAGTGSLTGTVSIADTYKGVTTTLATGLAVNASGVATFAITTLGVGVHTIVASYAGDSGHFSSTSTDNGVAPLLQTVNEQTTVTLTSSANPSLVGANVTFTATVAISGGGGVTPDGTISFMDGTTLLQTVALTGATATYQTNTLTAGVHPITAVYSGDTTIYVSGATSTVLDQDVGAQSTVALTSAPNPSTFGTVVLFTATVTSSSTTPPTGTITFMDGAITLGTGTLSGNPATATYSTGSLSVHTHSVTAVYSGDTNNASATSPVDLQVVNPAPVTVTVTSSLNPSNIGQSVLFTITVTAAAGTGSTNGTIQLVDTYNGVTTTLAPALALNAGGAATYTTAALAVGAHSLVATYSGDTTHASDPSLALIQTVDEATATTLTSSVNPSTFGQNVIFTATVAATGTGGVAPDGTVTFMDGTTALGTGTIAAGKATFSTATLAVGTHPITAVYNGDATNGIVGSTSAVLSQDVQSATTVTVASSLNPSTFGTSVTFTATVNSSSTVAPTGKVTFLDNGTPIGLGTLAGNPATASLQTSTLSVGTHPITVSYPGDANNAPGTTAAPLQQVVNGTQTSTTVTAAPSPGIANQPETITATVKVTTGSGTPTGTVTFTSGTTTLGTATLTAAGTATITPSLAVGTYQIVATYSGDAQNGGSASAAFPLTVGLATSTTALAVAPNPAVVGGTVTFTATVTGNGVAPTGTVTFLNGTATLGTGTIAAGKATFTSSTLAVGTYQITASYGGDTNNGTSTSAAVSLQVTLIPTTTGLATTTTTGANPQTVLIAVVQGTSGPTATGTVTFTSGANTIGTATLDASGVATLTPNLPTGSYNIVAAYGGDTLHAPSTSAAVSISSSPEDFSLTVAPAKVTLQASQNAPVTVSLTSNGGFTDTIGLGCSSLPAGVTCVFSNPTVNLAANATANVQLTIDTNTPAGGGSTAMNSQASGKGGVEMAGLFLPLSAFFGFLFWRLRKRGSAVWTLVLVMALSTAALVATGCSGYTSSKAAAGTYTIQVTGAGTNSDVIHYQNVTLDITN